MGPISRPVPNGGKFDSFPLYFRQSKNQQNLESYNAGPNTELDI